MTSGVIKEYEKFKPARAIPIPHAIYSNTSCYNLEVAVGLDSITTQHHLVPSQALAVQLPSVTAVVVALEAAELLRERSAAAINLMKISDIFEGKNSQKTYSPLGTRATRAARSSSSVVSPRAASSSSSSWRAMIASRSS